MQLIPQSSASGGRRGPRNGHKQGQQSQTGKHTANSRTNNQSKQTQSGTGTGATGTHSNQPSFGPQMHLAYEVKKLMQVFHQLVVI